MENNPLHCVGRERCSLVWCNGLEVQHATAEENSVMTSSKLMVLPVAFELVTNHIINILLLDFVLILP